MQVPVVRNGIVSVISTLLLSLQHSPIAFHKVRVYTEYLAVELFFSPLMIYLLTICFPLVAHVQKHLMGSLSIAAVGQTHGLSKMFAVV